MSVFLYDKHKLIITFLNIYVKTISKFHALNTYKIADRPGLEEQLISQPVIKLRRKFEDPRALREKVLRSAG